MLYLKAIALTDELWNYVDEEQYTTEMSEFFKVYKLNRDMDDIKEFLVSIPHIEETLVLSSDKEILDLSKHYGAAVLPCELSGLENFVGYEHVISSFQEADYLTLDKMYRRDKGIPWEILRTKRAIIREETVEDIDALYKMYESEHIKRFIEPLYPEYEKEKEYVEKYIKYIYGMYEYGIWIAEDIDTGAIIGRVGLEPKTFEDDVRGITMGYIIDKAYIRQGYCLELCTAVMDYARDVLNMNTLYLLIRWDNDVSKHIAEKLGFVYEKTLTDRDRQMCRYKIAFNE